MRLEDLRNLKAAKGGGLRDALLFGKVLSAGLVAAGYAFLGAWGSGWLRANGYPGWLSFTVLPAAVLFGLWQAWLFLTRKGPGRPPRENEERDLSKKSPRGE